MSEAYFDYIKVKFPGWADEVIKAATERAKYKFPDNNYSYYSGVLIGLGNAMTATFQCGDAFKFIDQAVDNANKGVVA